MSVKTRKLTDDSWEPWLGEGYHGAYSTMMIQKTSASAVSTRIINLSSGGHTETHSHERLHHVIALEGDPVLETDTENVLLERLTLVEIGSGVPHRFINNGETPAIILVINLFQ
ncbi:MAG: cupin domain-containing protein [Candidatus Bathyarchaeota archaeon]|nr:cupin domain-containing protein [Candidatus Bathyarchaeota archaeon]